MFIPKRIIFEKGSLDYPMAKEIYNTFKDDKSVEIIRLTNNKIKDKIPGNNLYDFYREGKNTLVVGIKKASKFQSCKPSANWQLPLLSGCIGHCQYCYLNTNLGDKPYIKVNVNTDDILKHAEDYIKENLPNITVFEGSATSDPIPVEPYTNSLKTAIEFFGETEYGRFRFVTKYNDVDTLLAAKHNCHTEVRFTINTSHVIDNFENRTASRDMRIDAAVKIATAGYPIGFLIAPVFLYDNWKEDYKNLLISLKEKLPNNLVNPVTFEVISHRYTSRAKSIIDEVFPQNTLPMKDDERKFKYGQFGYGKFVYTKEDLSEMKEFFNQAIEKIMPESDIKYII